MNIFLNRFARDLAARAFMMTAKAAISRNQALHPVCVVSYTLSVPQWPKGFNVSVALLSDIHMGVGMNVRRLNDVVRAINSLECDVIAVLGDMVDGTYGKNHNPEHDWSHALAHLRAPIAVAGVAGNHDHKGDIERVRHLFAQAEIPMLDNTALPLSKDGQKFWLAGLDSQLGAPVPSGQLRKGHHDIHKTLAAITDDAPAILLMHEPDIFDALPDRFPVAFAGHTHGGQIHLPWIGRPIVRAFPKRFHKGRAYGHFTSDDHKRQMVVTSGVGCSGIPVRFGVPPEIVRVDLKGTGF